MLWRLLLQICAAEVFLHGHEQNTRKNQSNDGIGYHVYTVVDQRVHMGIAEYTEAGDLGGHQDLVDGDAAEMVHQEPGRAAEDDAGGDTPAFAFEDTATRYLPSLNSLLHNITSAMSLVVLTILPSVVIQ